MQARRQLEEVEGESPRGALRVRRVRQGALGELNDRCGASLLVRHAQLLSCAFVAPEEASIRSCDAHDGRKARADQGCIYSPIIGIARGASHRVRSAFGVGFAAAILAVAIATPAWATPGDPDPSFGVAGHVRVQANESCQRRCVRFAGSYAHALALRPDGAIVLGGSQNHSYALTSQPPADEGALIRLLPNGALDSTFGSAGIEGTPFDIEQIEANAIGGLAAIGSADAGKIGVSRYTRAGLLDGFYGEQGVRWMPRPTGSVAMHRDSRGRVLALASFTLAAVDLVRYLPTGAPDPSFGHGGYVALFVPNASGHVVGPSESPPQAKPTAMALQPDGGIYVAFEAAPLQASDGAYWPSEYLLEHMRPGGRLDRAFGRHGLVRLRGEVTAMAVAPSGRLFAAWAEPSLGRRRPQAAQRIRRLQVPPQRLALGDYTPAGRQDRAFGKGGVALSRVLGGPLEVHAIAFDGAGDPLLVGEGALRTTDLFAGTAFLARYTRAGLDCSFGEDGLVVDPELDGASALAVQRDGRIVVAGWSGLAFAAARYLGGGPRRSCG